MATSLSNHHIPRLLRLAVKVSPKNTGWVATVHSSAVRKYKDLQTFINSKLKIDPLEI